MDSKFYQKSKDLAEHLLNVFPLVLVFIALSFVQILPALGDQIAKNIGIEICSSLGTKYVVSTDDIEKQQDKERQFCAVCALQSSLFFPHFQANSIVEASNNLILYVVPPQNQTFIKSSFNSAHPPRAPPVFS